jgi:4-amino-4-deoxy-L-arabinose transferase-like glycosyltransferase
MITPPRAIDTAERPAPTAPVPVEQAPAGQARTWRRVLFSDLGVLILLSLAWLVFLTLIDGRYGFHRDELNFLDQGRHLAWGYVEYPPLTPFIGRVAWELFGASLTGLRFFAALGVSVILVLSGLMARELGGSRRAQVVTALAVAIAPAALSYGRYFMYVTFDALWWVLAAYLVIRLVKTGNPRYWLGIGAALGLGMLTKWTIGFLALGIVAGVLLTPARKYLRTPWPWAGAGLALLIWAPNLAWQVQHNFISLDFLGSISARDVRIGRTGDYLVGQLYVCLNIAAIWIWLNGLYYCFFSSAGRRYRILGWMYVVPLVLFFVAHGRQYYLAPAYPMLLAAGCCQIENRWTARGGRWRNVERGVLYGLLAVGGVAMAAVVLPLAPVNSSWWQVSSSIFGEAREELGWPELVQTIAGIRDGLPAEERSRVGILATNYGEAGAVDLYGPAYGLPPAISGINSFWLRGYPEPPPATLIVVGLDHSDVNTIFTSCTLAGHTSNRDGVQNEETRDHPDIFVCRGLRASWPAFWQRFHYYG